jgi:VWFA-related protein
MRPAAVVVFALSLTAQESRFEVRSRMVMLPATVTDAQSHVVDGLEASDFIVLDNGRAQKVTVDTIGTGVAPVALVIAVQSSGISAAVLQKVQKIGGMIQPLITGERGCAALVSFAERVAWLQDCTSDPAALDRALRQLRPGDQKRARMLDAANTAIAHLGQRPNARRVLLLISESRDRGSEADLAVVAAAAQSAGVTVYAATYSAFKTAFTSTSPPSTTRRSVEQPVPNVYGTVDGIPSAPWDPKLIPPDQSVDLLSGIGELARLHKTNTTLVLTTGTGGATLPFTRQRGLEDAIEKLGAELNAQYILSFAPEASTVGYHVLEVRLARAGDFRIRARPGYWFAGSTQ